MEWTPHAINATLGETQRILPRVVLVVVDGVEQLSDGLEAIDVIVGEMDLPEGVVHCTDVLRNSIHTSVRKPDQILLHDLHILSLHLLANLN